MILRLFLNNVKKHPGKIAFKKKGEEINYKELALLSFKYAAILKKKKVKRVATLLENNFDHIALFIACLINKIEIMPLIEDINFINFLKSNNKKDLLITNKQKLKLKKSLNIDELRKQKNVKELEFPKIDIKKKFNYIVTFTSGTTGNPKTFKLSNINKYNRAYHSIKYFKFNRNDIFYMNTSLRFTISQRILHSTIMLGATCVLSDRFSTLNFKTDVNNFSITRVYCISNHITRIANSNISQKKINSLKTLISTSDTLQVDTKKKLIKKFKFDIYEVFGAAECGVLSSLLIKNNAFIDSVGTILDDTQLKILNKNKKTRIGKITFKSPRIYDSYGKKFFQTGDLGFTKNKNLYFVGREKDIIKSSGIFVYPKLIENKLNSLTFVRGCAVIGIENKYYGELIIAVLLLNKKVNIDYFYKYSLRNLSKDQRPHLFLIEKDFPKNKQEKIVKSALKKQIIKKYKSTFEKFDVSI